jgi:hypothetical protein
VERNCRVIDFKRLRVIGYWVEASEMIGANSTSDHRRKIGRKTRNKKNKKKASLLQIYVSDGRFCSRQTDFVY